MDDTIGYELLCFKESDKARSMVRQTERSWKAFLDFVHSFTMSSFVFLCVAFCEERNRKMQNSLHGVSTGHKNVCSRNNLVSNSVCR